MAACSHRVSILMYTAHESWPLKLPQEAVHSQTGGWYTLSLAEMWSLWHAPKMLIVICYHTQQPYSNDWTRGVHVDTCPLTQHLAGTSVVAVWTEHTYVYRVYSTVCIDVCIGTDRSVHVE